MASSESAAVTATATTTTQQQQQEEESVSVANNNPAATTTIITPETSPLRKNHKEQQQQTPDTTVVVSQDYGQEEDEISDLEQDEKNNTSPKNDSKSTTEQQQKEEIVVSVRADPELSVASSSSSDDDSSYFADPNILPEPGSHQRRYSWGSQYSQNSQQQQQPQKYESDASLSFSDDDDSEEEEAQAQQQTGLFQQQQQQRQQEVAAGSGSGDHRQQHHRQHRQHQRQQNHNSKNTTTTKQQSTSVVPEVYPGQLMRRHSVSSLVSTASGDEHSDDDDSTTSSSASDTSVREELQNVAVERRERDQQQRAAGSSSTSNSSAVIHIPSGRLSPILGEHPPSRQTSAGGFAAATPTTTGHNPSPPTIFAATQQQQQPNYHHNIIHPQPHTMTSEQLSAWNHFQQQQQQAMMMMMMAGGGGGGPQQPASEQQQPLPGLALGGPSYSKDSSDLAYSSMGSHDEIGGSSSRSHPAAANDRTITRNKNVSQQQQHHWSTKSDGGGKKTKNDTSSSSSRGLLATNNTEQGNNKSEVGVGSGGFKVYWQRWIMLFYMSILNLLSDWTCYSVAPIALLTEEAFGHINAEQLVVVFLAANGISTACEPIILSRLGLRRTVLFGALLLMIGSMIKSGGMPPIIQPSLTKGQGEWRVYFGFFLVGLSQPLYQCTPALLSASWFPEVERTMATGVALNANQLGIGFAFIFGTLLVATSDDIPKYFALLSMISTLTFLGALAQFQDAPPTPPSSSAKVMRGTLEVNLPSVQTIFDSVRQFGSGFDHSSGRNKGVGGVPPSKTSNTETKSYGTNKEATDGRRDSGQRRSSRSSRGGEASSKGRRVSGSGTRRRNTASKTQSASVDNGGEKGFHGLVPSPARWGSVSTKKQQNHAIGSTLDALVHYPAPSPMMPGGVASSNDVSSEDEAATPQESPGAPAPHMPYGSYPGYPGQPPATAYDEGGLPYNPYPGFPSSYPAPYWDPRFQQYAFMQQQQAFQPGYAMPPPDPYYQYYSYQHAVMPPPHTRAYEPVQNVLPSTSAIDEGAEPVITLTPHHMDIDIRDDQILLSTRACLARPGFIHSLVSFTVSGIVINTLSTFMDYLVRLNGAGREYTGIVGGSFQFGIMISSLIVGKICDRTRAYYSVTIGMLVLGAFGLAECGVSLDADRGTTLRWSLVVVALLVGPLQPVSTELGVDVVYPLSENTVLVIQQLFSNLLSAAFIPCFKAMKDIGAVVVDEAATERPEYTFSFYLLIVLHAAATVFFATFNGRYLRYEHELEKKAQEEQQRQVDSARAFHRIAPADQLSVGSNEHAPLVPNVV